MCCSSSCPGEVAHGRLGPLVPRRRTRLPASASPGLADATTKFGLKPYPPSGRRRASHRRRALALHAPPRRVPRPLRRLPPGLLLIVGFFLLLAVGPWHACWPALAPCPPFGQWPLRGRVAQSRRVENLGPHEFYWLLSFLRPFKILGTTAFYNCRLFSRSRVSPSRWLKRLRGSANFSQPPRVCACAKLLDGFRRHSAS